jgi:hypothetical protein
LWIRLPGGLMDHGQHLVRVIDHRDRLGLHGRRRRCSGLREGCNQSVVLSNTRMMPKITRESTPAGGVELIRSGVARTGHRLVASGTFRWRPRCSRSVAARSVSPCRFLS